MVNNVAVKVSNLSKEFLLGQDKTVSILKDVSLRVSSSLIATGILTLLEKIGV